jgi:hypothetical protein
MVEVLNEQSIATNLSKFCNVRRMMILSYGRSAINATLSETSLLLS